MRLLVKLKLLNKIQILPLLVVSISAVFTLLTAHTAFAYPNTCNNQPKCEVVCTHGGIMDGWDPVNDPPAEYACKIVNDTVKGIYPDNSVQGTPVDPCRVTNPTQAQQDACTKSGNAGTYDSTTQGNQLTQVCGFGTQSSGTDCSPTDHGSNSCGDVKTSINFGCKKTSNAVLGLVYAIIRFLAAGVGVVLIASLIVAGIQYSASRGDPNSSAAAIKRIQSTFAALLLYLFAYALLNYLIPGGFLNK